MDQDFASREEVSKVKFGKRKREAGTHIGFLLLFRRITLDNSNCSLVVHVYTKSSATKEEAVVSVRDGFSNLSLDPPLVSSQPDSATTAAPQNVASPNNGDESKANLESRNDMEDLELQHAVIKVQAAFRAHQVLILCYNKDKST